jgi:predicted ester cyclase
VSIAANKETYGRIIEAIGRNDPDALEDLMDPAIVDHNPMPEQPPGVTGFKAWLRAVKSSFPDLEGTVESVIAEGDRVAGHVTWRGTHRGEFLGLAPTNKQVAMAAFHVVRFSAGRAAEWWGTADLLGGVQQLGGTITPPAG